MDDHQDQDQNQVGTSTPKTKNPRLYHKKSRYGCIRCRERRVKCDESKPSCTGCKRHSVPCSYIKNTLLTPIKPPVHQDQENGSSSTSPRGRSCNPSPQPTLPFLLPPQELDLSGSWLAPPPTEPLSTELPESTSRRKLELLLLQNFIANTSSTLPATHTPAVLRAWLQDAPTLALEHDNLLHEIFALSSLHLLHTTPGDSTLLTAHETYAALSLQGQRAAVTILSSKNADAVCMASSLIIIDAFAVLTTRPRDPYVAPLEWLRIARGGASMYMMALHTIAQFSTEKITALIQAQPVLRDLDVLFAASNRDALNHILSQSPPFNTEPWDLVTQSTYEKALSYIGGIQREIAKGEDRLATLRRMMAFPMLVPREFVEFLDEGRPRALVVLAWYFALTEGMEDIWWVGQVPRWEVEGIYRAIGGEWRGLMGGPVRAFALDGG